MHLRRVDGAFFNTYIESFERVWASARAPESDLAGVPWQDQDSRRSAAPTTGRPARPAPTSRKPSASVVLRNHSGELLLLRRADSGRWTIPTGALKKKETLTACAIRECREETGLAVELTGLVGVFSDPRHRIAYPDGEVRVPVNVCFHGQPLSGELRTDEESTQAAWVPPEDLDGYDIHPAILRRISHALHGTAPHVD